MSSQIVNVNPAVNITDLPNMTINYKIKNGKKSLHREKYVKEPSNSFRSTTALETSKFVRKVEERSGEYQNNKT